jgi:hypothetical protein
MVSVPATVLEAAEIGVVHQTDVAHLGAFDNDDIVLVEVLALVDKFQGCLQKGISRRSRQKMKQIMARSLSAPRVNIRPLSQAGLIYYRPLGEKAQRKGEKQCLCCRRVFIGGIV